MGRFDEKISDDSLWLTATPSPTAMTLPFYITEAGHFKAEREYCVERPEHDSHLLLFTINGCGKVVANDTEIPLEKNSAVLIDCHKHHKYFSCTPEWDFFWIHLHGNAVTPLFAILYPGKENSIKISEPEAFERKISAVISGIKSSDISAAIMTSCRIHELFGILTSSAMENEQRGRRRRYEDDIAAAVEFIQKNYPYNITIDDIIGELHISKYHFIRIFNRIMGVAPYSYLTAYRINTAKTLLCTTDKSVAEIAEECGFPDTSNFISHFKGRTGRRPLQYRRDFS